MSSQRQTCTIWTCDVCEHVETVDDSGSGYPSGWSQVATAPITAQLGNTSAKHLCPDCRDALGRLLTNTLGDTGDMGEAWHDGYLAGWGDRDMDETDPLPAGEQHDTSNPYRPARQESTDD